MPTYNQGSFIRRAIQSLVNQKYKYWELIIVNDGSTDCTEDFLTDILSSSSFSLKYLKNEKNMGLGAAINQALRIAKYDYIAYLPSDDVYEINHLETFQKVFEKNIDAVLVYSGIRYDSCLTSQFCKIEGVKGVIPGYSLQLVQTAHKKTKDYWIERSECISDDLFFTFWRKLTDKGSFLPTNKITCEWTNHPLQRHKITAEKYGGGLNKYRKFYNVQHPLRMRTSSSKTIDEYELYKDYRNKNPFSKKQLKILLVGDLAYYSERIYAFEEDGHKLYGLWATPIACYSTIGPLPFGNVEDVPYNTWREEIKKIKPDIIYGQISTGAISIAHEVLTAKTGVPIVWHFKESPHEAMKVGLWDKLIDLYSNADGKIYLSDTSRRYFNQFIYNRRDVENVLILDPELPKSNCFTSNFSQKLSVSDQAIHTVIIGRMIGIGMPDFAKMAANNIHLHIYNENYANSIDLIAFKKLAPNFFHIHDHCSQRKWVEEFSKYDAGWLHCFDSKNHNNYNCLQWSDLNIPARINVLVAAGLPIIQKANSGHIVAMRDYVQDRDIGIFYKNIDDLIKQLNDKKEISRLHANIIAQRMQFTFDYHVPKLINFFRKVITENVNNEQTIIENCEYGESSKL
jgi:glycosyltransferase involved in cell wall biosynthesis